MKNNQTDEPLVKSYSRIIAEIEQAISEQRNSDEHRTDARRHYTTFGRWAGIVPA